MLVIVMVAAVRWAAVDIVEVLPLDLGSITLVVVCFAHVVMVRIHRHGRVAIKRRSVGWRIQNLLRRALQVVSAGSHFALLEP